MFEQRDAAANVAAPCVRCHPECEPQAEHALDPTLEDGRKAHEVDRCHEGQGIRLRNLGLLLGHVARWPERMHPANQLAVIAFAYPALDEKPAQGIVRCLCLLYTSRCV